MTVFFQGVSNVDVENVVKYSTDFWSVRENNSNKGTRLLNAWSPSNSTSTIPALTSSDANAEGFANLLCRKMVRIANSEIYS